MPYENRTYGHLSRHGRHHKSSYDRGCDLEPASRIWNKREWLWGCHNCGLHAGMSTFTDHCPECQHLRCEYCFVERVKRRRYVSDGARTSRTGLKLSSITVPKVSQVVAESEASTTTKVAMTRSSCEDEVLIPLAHSAAHFDSVRQPVEIVLPSDGNEDAIVPVFDIRIFQNETHIVKKSFIAVSKVSSSSHGIPGASWGASSSTIDAATQALRDSSGNKTASKNGNHVETGKISRSTLPTATRNLDSGKSLAILSPSLPRVWSPSQTTVSTPLSNCSIGTPRSQHILIDSATEIDSEDMQSDGNETDGSEFGYGQISHVFRPLETHVVSILSFDLDLAARMIHDIQGLIESQCMARGGVLSLENSQSSVDNENFSEATPKGKSSKIFWFAGFGRGQATPWSSRGQKRGLTSPGSGRNGDGSSSKRRKNDAGGHSGRGSGGNADGGIGGSSADGSGTNESGDSGSSGDNPDGVPENQRDKVFDSDSGGAPDYNPQGPGDDPGETEISAETPVFACHFYKRDSQKYGPWTSRMYAMCPSSSIAVLRRIKYHFKAAHSQPQCPRCYLILPNKNLLQEHLQNLELCPRGVSVLKEGIDDGQWEKIQSILKSRKGQKQMTDFQRWYAIWDVLFPGVPHPSNPWNEPPSSTPSTTYDVDKLSNIFANRIEKEIQRGSLELEINTQHQIMEVFRHTLLEHRAAAGLLELQSSGEKEKGKQVLRGDQDTPSLDSNQAHSLGGSSPCNTRQQSPIFLNDEISAVWIDNSTESPQQQAQLPKDLNSSLSHSLDETVFIPNSGESTSVELPFTNPPDVDCANHDPMTVTDCSVQVPIDEADSFLNPTSSDVEFQLFWEFLNGASAENNTGVAAPHANLSGITAVSHTRSPDTVPGHFSDVFLDGFVENGFGSESAELFGPPLISHILEPHTGEAERGVHTTLEPDPGQEILYSGYYMDEDLLFQLDRENDMPGAIEPWKDKNSGDKLLRQP